MEPTKEETLEVFKVLKGQKANKVRREYASWWPYPDTLIALRAALIARPEIRHGQV